MTDHKVVSPADWTAAREELLAREKEHTRVGDELARNWVTPMLEQLPPIVERNAKETGTDVVGYMTELFGVSVFAREDGVVYHTYSTGGRGVEFLMGYYGILDRVPKGRDEGDAFQVWIRRHDEY